MDRSLLRDALLAAGLAAAATLLSMLAVYVGTGLLDGFGDWDLHRIGRRFHRYMPHALLGAVLAGPMLRSYYAQLLKTPPAAWTLVVSIPRAFIHFAFFGLVVLVGMVALAAWNGLAWLVSKLRLLVRASPHPIGDGAKGVGYTALAVPIWFLMFPFTALGAVASVDMCSELNDRMLQPRYAGLRRRMLKLLPWLFASMLFWVGAESEDTGARVDPYWLTAFASYWFGDYLIVAFQVVPALRAREIAAQAPGA